MRINSRIVTIGLSALISACVTTQDSIVGYPEGFRTWQHVKTMLIQPGHPLEEPFGGIHHVYANPKAISGMDSGEYESGSTFVFDLLNYTEDSQTITEGARKRIDMMLYDSSRYAASGGWGFATYMDENKTLPIAQDVQRACFQCHQSAEPTSFVFSKLRD